MIYRANKRTLFIVVFMLSLLIISGCNRPVEQRIETSELFTFTSDTTEPTTEPTTALETEAKSDNEKSTPVSKHGQLKLEGMQIVDQTGAPVQLRGVSTHGIQWFPEYVSLEAFKTMRDDWDVSVVRLAMYTDPNVGYDEKLHALVENGVAYATELDLYVIIDWHILSDGNPNQSKDRAIKFFGEMSEKYKDNPNVIYEICNEPNGDVTWSRDIKPYAESVIEAIRKNDQEALIIVGTPTWSQDVDIVANDPIKNQNNILYALHFYAATHKEALRAKLATALKVELPLFVSEFGISDASGSGVVDYEQGDIWLDLLESHGIGYVAWNLSNKNETSALIRFDVSKVSDWQESDLSPWGRWFIERIRQK